MKHFSFTDRTYFRSKSVTNAERKSATNRYSASHLLALSAFTSRQCRQSLSKTIQSSSVMSRGCCVLVDISGFSKLSQVAFVNGISGLDHFRHLVSDVFNALIGLIDEHGGDGELIQQISSSNAVVVISFAGDALICYFAPTSPTSAYDMISPECIVRALDCALSMCQLQIDRISVHCAVASGDVCFGILGGYESMWTHVMSAPCFADMSCCIDEAGSREVVIASNMYVNYRLHIERCFSCVRLESGNLKIIRVKTAPKLTGDQAIYSEATSYDAETLVKFIPKPVHSAVISDTLTSLAEVRIITTLFLRLDSYDGQRMRDLIALQPFYLAMQEVVFEHGGYIRQFVIDDKGCVLIVLWGVAGASFPNNCCRAVYCAASMLTRAHELNHACSVGITTGTAYCGTVGSNNRQDYVAMGKMVNIAARLMSVAKGRILLDTATKECLPQEVLEQVETCVVGQLKGFKHDDTVYQYIITKRRRGISAMLNDVPRDECLYVSRTVLASLENVISTAKQLSSDPRLGTHYVFIKGVPGSGKTSILQKLCRDGTKAGVRMICIRLSSKHMQETYALFRKIMLECLHLQEIEVEDALSCEHLRPVFPEDGDEHLSLLRIPVLRNVLYPPRLSSKTLKSLANKNRIQPQLPMDETIIKYLGECLNVLSISFLIIDGAEYASETSWRVLARFDQFAVPVFIVASISMPLGALEKDVSGSHSWNTNRVSTIIARYGSQSCDDPIGDNEIDTVMANMHLIVDASHRMTISLDTLDFEDVCRYIQEEALSTTPVSLSVMEHVYDISKGNAFWVFLLIRFISDCGVEEFESLLDLQIADNVLVTCLLSQYNMQQVTVIKLASVIGEEFDLRTLRKVVSRMTHAELNRVLTQFVHSGLIHRKGYDKFSFQNVLIRNVIYEFIPRSDAEKMHVRVARAILSDQGDDEELLAARLAFHYSSAGAEYAHHAMRYALLTSHHLLHQGNAAHGVCYIALALRIASSKADYVKILDEICTVEAMMLVHGRVHRSTSDHLDALKVKAINAISKREKQKPNRRKTHVNVSVFLRFLCKIKKS